MMQDETQAKAALYEARLNMFATVAALAGTGLPTNDIMKLIDTVEARLLAPEVTRTWTVRWKSEDGPRYFAGWAGPFPSWTDRAAMAVRFARRQDAEEVLATMPLEDEGFREQLGSEVYGGLA